MNTLSKERPKAQPKPILLLRPMQPTPYANDTAMIKKKALSIINEGNSVSKSKEIEYLPNIYNIKRLGNPSFFNINDKKNENNL